MPDAESPRYEGKGGALRAFILCDPGGIAIRL